MSINSDKDITEAILTGMVGLAGLLIAIKQTGIMLDNFNLVSYLVLAFFIIAIIRVYGIILNINFIKRFSVYLFKSIILPYTLWIIPILLITELNWNSSLFISKIIYIIFFELAFVLSGSFAQKTPPCPKTHSLFVQSLSSKVNSNSKKLSSFVALKPPLDNEYI